MSEQNNSDSVNENQNSQGVALENERQLTGFTRGPWEISTTELGGREAWPCIRGAIDQHGGWVVALIDQACVSASDDEPQANARLIAASPSLHGAVNDLLSAMEMQEGREREELHITQPVALDIWNKAKENARAALALVSEQATATAKPRTSSDDPSKG